MQCTNVCEQNRAFSMCTASASHFLWSTTHPLWSCANETY